jgi:hypothetical protein
MELESFEQIDKIIDGIKRIGQDLDNASLNNLSRIFYDALKISRIKLEEKKAYGKKKRDVVSLSRRDISGIINHLAYFHANDSCTVINDGSQLATFFNNQVNEGDVSKYCSSFLVGTQKDKFGREILFNSDFIKCFYKNKEGRHVIAPENLLLERAKRLPFILESLRSATAIFQRIDERKNYEIMYIHRFKESFKNFSNSYFYALLAEKYYKDVQNPPVAKTAFPIFSYETLLTRIAKYEPVKKEGPTV